MSQDYIFNFSHGLERSSSASTAQDQIRVDEGHGGLPAVYDTGGMLSEMFNFPTGGPELLNYHRSQRAGDWYANTAQAMQLLLSTDGGEEGVNGSKQRLSLSLSNLQHLEGSKVEELYFNNQVGGDCYRNLHVQGGVTGQTQQQIHMGFGSSSWGIGKDLRNSRYAKAAQELLEEFCSVGRGGFKKHKFRSKGSNSDQNPANSGDGGGGFSSSKDLPSLSCAERIEHQRRKVKLCSMIVEVDRRYNHYCEQMQMVVNSFDLVMGYGSAMPYTSLAQKAMSRHFRCLKDVITEQLKHSCELLGEKHPSSCGVTRGETPRLKLLEQCLRQQRALHQMGMMEQEAWRPQRGLPERSVNILRAWLFEHFLHPYPSDADKHLLGRQSGLSKNQVSNWFINARVRLWKPMVEEMYQQEAKEEDNPNPNPNNQEYQQHKSETTNINSINNQHKNGPSPESSSSSAVAQTPIPPPLPPPPSTTTTTPTPATTTTEINESENDPSIHAINTQNCFSENPFIPATHVADIGSTVIRFGATAGDVSLTLGLRQAGNVPENASFSIKDFGGC